MASCFKDIYNLLHSGNINQEWLGFAWCVFIALIGVAVIVGVVYATKLGIKLYKVIKVQPKKAKKAKLTKEQKLANKQAKLNKKVQAYKEKLQKKLASL